MITTKFVARKIPETAEISACTVLAAAVAEAQCGVAANTAVVIVVVSVVSGGQRCYVISCQETFLSMEQRSLCLRKREVRNVINNTTNCKEMINFRFYIKLDRNFAFISNSRRTKCTNRSSAGCTASRRQKECTLEGKIAITFLTSLTSRTTRLPRTKFLKS